MLNTFYCYFLIKEKFKNTKFVQFAPKLIKSMTVVDLPRFVMELLKCKYKWSLSKISPKRDRVQENL